MAEMVVGAGLAGLAAELRPAKAAPSRMLVPTKNSTLGKWGHCRFFATEVVTGRLRPLNDE